MITITSYRQDLEAVRNFFVPFITLLQQTRLNNVAHANIQSDEYLTTLAVNYLIDELTEVIEKKYAKPGAGTVKIKFTNAQAIIFFRLLILLPVPANAFYLQKLRNDLVLQLDNELITQAIYKHAVQNPEKDFGTVDPDFEDDEYLPIIVTD